MHPTSERGMTVVAVIPARYAATRFPGKPLANKTGKYMIQHVYERVRMARRIDRVIIATEDERILQAVKSFGGEARMTRADHVSGTDRVGEVADALDLADDDIVLNVQGDEPEVEPTSLDRLVERMMNDECGMRNGGEATGNRQQAIEETSKSRNVEKSGHEGWHGQAQRRHAQQPPIVPLGKGDGNMSRDREGADTQAQQVTIGTIAAAFDDSGPKEGPGSPLDPNCVKVVVDLAGNAMYFSRSPIPYPRDSKGAVDRPSRWLLHMGVYAFRCETLTRINGGRMKPSVLERAESLEQLRWLENGFPIAVVVVPQRSVGIDTPEDYEAFVKRNQNRDR